MQLIAAVQKALAEENYQTPTPIQAQTVPPALSGRDVLGCAQTGTGKTAAFALPILNRLGQHNRKAVPNRPFVLVLAPTRELAIQIGESFATYGRHLKLRQALVYGGVGQAQQVRSLKRGVHLLIATPGRLLDLMNQGHIHLDQLESFVLDEADRMLDMGFLPDLKRIIARLPDERQSLFFSATLPPKIIELSRELLSDPINVNVTPTSTSVELIDQRVLYVERPGKQRLLQEILTAGDVNRALVFTRTKRGANMVAEKLHKSGITATAIHGNKTQAARQRALEAFRRKHVQVLVATDVAARGIDIDGITHVVNFDLPVEPEAYVHRIGRTGRAGAEGTALSFCTAEEHGELRAIEKLIGQKVPADPRGGSEPRPRTGGHQSSGPRGSGQHGSGPRGGRPQRRKTAAGARQQSRTRRPGVRPAQEIPGIPEVLDANTRPHRPRRKGRNRRQRAAQTT
jgi:ATP-dependent RNA helicase RhlE